MQSPPKSRLRLHMTPVKKYFTMQSPWANGNLNGGFTLQDIQTHFCSNSNPKDINIITKDSSIFESISSNLSIQCMYISCRRPACIQTSENPSLKMFSDFCFTHLMILFEYVMHHLHLLRHKCFDEVALIT